MVTCFWEEAWCMASRDFSNIEYCALLYTSTD